MTSTKKMPLGAFVGPGGREIAAGSKTEFFRADPSECARTQHDITAGGRLFYAIAPAMAQQGAAQVGMGGA